MEKRKQGRPKANEVVNENFIKFGCFIDRELHEKAMFMADQTSMNLKTYVMKAIRNQVIHDAAIYMEKQDKIIECIKKEHEKEILTVAEIANNIRKQIYGRQQ